MLTLSVPVKVNYEKVMVTEVTPEGNIFAQHFAEGPKLEALMKEIREEFTANPPLAGAYQPKRGDLVNTLSPLSIYLRFPTSRHV